MRLTLIYLVDAIDGMSESVLVIGGTRFIGRHTVQEFLAHEYAVTIFNRGNHDNPFADDDRVDHVQGDRREKSDLQTARTDVDPDIVVDCVAYYPEDVREATDIFSDVDAYVYVSSGSAYNYTPSETAGIILDVPLREDETALHPCTAEQATDDSMNTYGPRKAEGDRAAFEAAENGVNATVVRPMLVYGPHDHTERFAYWVHRVAHHDRVLVPGDGGCLSHLGYVEDVARSLRLVAEQGSAGEAYNVGDRNTFSLARSLELIAEALNTDVDIVTASERELAANDLDPGEFPLYVPSPAIASTGKLHALGWSSTPPAEAVARTAQAHVEHGRTGEDAGPDRQVEEAAIRTLTQ